MNNKSLERYLVLRNEIQTELIDIDGEMEDCRLRLAQLEENREVLAKALNGEISEATFPDEPVDKVVVTAVVEDKPEVVIETNGNGDPSLNKLVNFIHNNPGVDRAQINEHFGNTISEVELKGLMGRASKRGLIENRGSKRFSQWYFTAPVSATK
jgi:hypothetical protein